MKRKLGGFEHAAALTEDYEHFKIAGALRINGPLRPEVLRQALDILQKRQPMLRVRLLKEGNAYFFDSEGVPEIPLSVIDRQSDDQWIGEVENALNAVVDKTIGPLMQCSLLRSPSGDGAQEIVVCFHHAVADAASSSSVVTELLDLCGRLQNGEDVSVGEPFIILPPSEARFPAAYQGLGRVANMLLVMARQMADEVSYQVLTLGKRKPPIHDGVRGLVLTVRMPEDVTTGVIRRARRERVTVNSVLNAAMLLSVWKHLYAGQDIPLRFMTFANLRPYLKPPVEDDVLGCHISTSRFTVQMRQNRDFWDLASDINRKVYRFTSRGEKFIAALMSRQLMAMTFKLRAFRMATTAISYPGVLEMAENYGPIELLGTHAFVSNFGLGPEYTAQARIFRGELWLDIIYLDTDMDHAMAQTIADEMQSIMVSATQ